MADPSHLGGDVGGTLLGQRLQLRCLTETETEELRGLPSISEQGFRLLSLENSGAKAGTI